MNKTTVKSSKLVFCTYLSHFSTVLDDFFSGQPVKSSTLSSRVRVRVSFPTPRGWPMPLPKNYSSASNSYLTFVRLHHLPVDPTPDTLSFFTVFMSHHINPKSVSAYLSGICQQLEPYFPNVRASRHTPLVDHMLKGCLHLRGSAITRKRALTFTDLQLVLSDLSSSTHHDDLLFKSMLLTGFFALMRLGELTFPNDIKLRNWKKVSKRSSVVLSTDQYQFHLPGHKADQFFEGNTIIIKQKQYCDINPLSVFSEYLSSRDILHPLSSPLWLKQNGSVPTRQFFITRLRQSPLLCQRRRRPIDESRRRHITCGTWCPHISHPVHGPLVFRRVLHLHP